LYATEGSLADIFFESIGMVDSTAKAKAVMRIEKMPAFGLKKGMEAKRIGHFLNSGNPEGRDFWPGIFQSESIH
jgi:hypothetical protein